MLINMMHTIQDLDDYQPYSLDSTTKNLILGNILYDLEKETNKNLSSVEKSSLRSIISNKILQKQ